MAVQYKALLGREIAYTVNEQGCHIPTIKPTSKQGYVQTVFNRKKYYLHRVAFATYYDMLVKGRVIMHNCDNPTCFNAGHLSLGTQADNMRDMALKGRSKGINAGSSNGNVKHTEDIIRAIYVSEGSFDEIAEQFNVKRKLVENVKYRVQWKQATEGLVKPIMKRGRRPN